MPGLPHHRCIRRLRRAKPQQRRRLADARVDRGLAEESAGAGPRYHRAPPQLHGSGNQRIDGLPDATACAIKAANTFRGLGHSSRLTGGGSMKPPMWIIMLVLLVSAGTAGCRKNNDTGKAAPLLAAYDSEPDWTDSQKIVPLSYQ